jgi:hypothetical protein
MRLRALIAFTTAALGVTAAVGVTGAWAQGAGKTPEPGAPREVKALHYGDTLFEFFQERHFSALTGLMVSQHFARVAPHDDDAEVLRGGLLLSYGLHEEAGDVFALLIENNAAPAVRDRAWYHLAKIRYQRGLPGPAEEALARIENPLRGALEEERRLLQAQLLMGRADHAGAAALLDSLPKERSVFARYNLGVALVKAGDFARGSKLLDEIGLQGAATEEQRSLRDRANVALGFGALQNKQPADARRYLQRVRLDGLHASKALLGFGWAAQELGEPRSALVPWNELLQRPLSDPAVLEARIAVPFAYAELGASRQALERYEDAATRFDGERRALDSSVAEIRSGRMVAALLERNPGAGLGWYGQLHTLPPALPHAPHLAGLMAQHPFQESFKNLRDIVFIGDNLQAWRDKLASYTDMLDNRRQAFAERLPKVRAAAGAADLPALMKRRDALAAELDRVEREGDAAALASEQERDWQQRIERGAKALAGAAEPAIKAQGEIAEPAELASAAERLRRVAGALAWQQTQQFPDRLWQARKAQRQAERTLAEAEERDAALLRAQAEEPARFERFAARIKALQERIAALEPRVLALHKEQSGELQDIAVAELEGQKERLEVYATQARLAIAQLLDRAQLAQAAPTPASTEAPRAPR